MKETLLFCAKKLTKQEQEIVATYPNVDVILTRCEQLDESNRVVIQLPDITFYGNVTPDRIKDILIRRADDIKIQTARLFDVSMKTYRSDVKYRSLVWDLYDELEDLFDWNEDAIDDILTSLQHHHKLSKQDTEYAIKMALIKTTKGPKVEDLLVGLGWKKIKELLDDFKSHSTYRI
jgi:glutamyl/glutaminyl-tRNA synthetase